MITVSIVSHGHGALIPGLLCDLARCPQVANVIVTCNIPESEVEFPGSTTGNVTVLSNERPKGFAANHNAAFKYCNTTFFCVINPDVRFKQNPFHDLLSAMEDGQAAICAPRVLSPRGELEDSVRKFPTPLNILGRILHIADARIHFEPGCQLGRPDWVAGMFMLFRSSNYAGLNGFDEGYFLYCEDADICARAWLAGSSVLLCCNACVIHDARRTSHRDFQFVRWHVASLVRFFYKFRHVELIGHV